MTNQLNFIEVNDVRCCYMDDVRRLYGASFPIEERRAWADFEQKVVNENRFTLNVILGEKGCFLGFITIWNLGIANYVEHFAIHSQYRNLGIGGQVIDQLVKSIKEPIVLEVELPETGETAQKRIAFYERHLLKTCSDYKYVQPSYGNGLPEVPLMLMVSSADNLDMDVVTRKIHYYVYGKSNR